MQGYNTADQDEYLDEWVKYGLEFKSYTTPARHHIVHLRF